MGNPRDFWYGEWSTIAVHSLQSIVQVRFRTCANAAEMEERTDEFRDEYVMVQVDAGDARTESVQPVELPAEDDGTLLLTVLQSQFEGATGLKYR